MSKENIQAVFYPYTDLGNAKRWAKLFSIHYQWVYENKQWFRWNGSRWEPDNTGSNTYIIDEVIDNIANDAAIFKEMLMTKRLEEGEYQSLLKENRKWQMISQSAGKIHAAVRLASCQPGVSRSFTDFDNKGKFLGVNNGIIKLATSELVVDKPEYYVTKTCNTDYLPEARCPNWLKFLEQIFEGCEDTISFIQRLFGQGLLGTADKDKLIIMCGSGANGKSTLTDTMVELLGGYALATSANTVMQSKANKDYYLAELKGIRLSIINESKKGAYLDEGLVKSLVDSGEIQARQIYQAPISFQPVATPILTTNYTPKISADYSINRRILLVPFNFQLPSTRRDPNFRAKVLRPELPGILNWALEGCRHYLEVGLNPPRCIDEATREYISENDRIERFIDEKMIIDPAGRAKLKEVKDHYVMWSSANGFREVSSDRVAMEFRHKGYSVEKRNNGVYHVLGVRFRTREDDRKQKKQEEEIESKGQFIEFD